MKGDEGVTVQGARGAPGRRRRQEGLGKVVAEVKQDPVGVLGEGSVPGRERAWDGRVPGGFEEQEGSREERRGEAAAQAQGHVTAQERLGLLLRAVGSPGDVSRGAPGPTPVWKSHTAMWSKDTGGRGGREAGDLTGGRCNHPSGGGLGCGVSVAMSSTCTGSVRKREWLDAVRERKNEGGEVSKRG